MNLRSIIISILLPIITALNVIAGPGSIADEALVTASSSIEGYPESNVIDGEIRIHNKGAWACEGQTTFWGFIRYPWIQLDWAESQTINRVVLYDRPDLDEHTAGGTLIFSDGSEIPVTQISNDGAPKTIHFEPKTVKWVRFRVMDGVGFNLGLSEIEIFPAHNSHLNLVDWVDPFIETTRGRYFYFTPGATPFGMMASAPITRNKNQYGGGYNYNSTEILGFGNLHGWMISGIQVMPTIGSIDPTKGEQEWKSSFSHQDEIAQPGYQRVFLEDYKTWVELTSTKRTTQYRFKYTQKSSANILTNLGGYLGNSTMTGANIQPVGNTGFEGSFISSGRLWGGPKQIKVFFVVEFDQPFDALDGWNDQKIIPNFKELNAPIQMTRRDSMDYGVVVQSYWDAPSAGASARFDVNPGDEIQMRISISYTSLENARNNMFQESKSWDFEKYRKENQNAWEDLLSRILISGGTNDQKVKFYTDLWHVLLGRHIINDFSGDYPDYTEGQRDWKFTDAVLKVRQLPKHKNGNVKYNMYNSDALWLTQWNINVLWGLAWPEILDDFSASMVQYADNGDLLPRGPNIGGYSYIMTGTPVSNMLVSAYQKDILTKVSPKHALDVMKRNHTPGGMMGDDANEVSFYIENGYAPGNAGKTIEWAFQDWSLAQMASKMGRKKDAEYYSKRASRWTIIYRPEFKLIFPKMNNGNWLHDDPLSMEGWVEANAWQGTWSVSHAIPELAELMGGTDSLCSLLNYAFEKSESDDFVFGYGSGYVSYANQPGCSNAHVFNYAGKPWLSQYWVRKVNEQAYGGTTPDKGYGGHDEDQGQMGGVSALMSMGLFSLRGNNSINPIYDITSPVFDEIIIKLNPDYYPGKEFRIITENANSENPYIQSAKLNGKGHPHAWFYHSDYAKGGELRLVLGAEPNYNWGK